MLKCRIYIEVQCVYIVVLECCCCAVKMNCDIHPTSSIWAILCISLLYNLSQYMCRPSRDHHRVCKGTFCIHGIYCLHRENTNINRMHTHVIN
jgi:hypothetical protein